MPTSFGDSLSKAAMAAVRRPLAIALVLQGYSRTEAAELSGMDGQTLRDWVHRYNDEGIDGLKSRSLPVGLLRRPRSSWGARRRSYRDETDDARGWALAVCRSARGGARRFSVEVHESTVGKWLHQLGRRDRNLVPFTRRKIPPRRMRVKTSSDLPAACGGSNGRAIWIGGSGRKFSVDLIP